MRENYHLLKFLDIYFPMVSLILPSRYEEKYMEKCLDSLLRQDYPNYEIIAINDCSLDRTGEIIKRYGIANSNIIYVDAQPKPEGWTGKNWTCYQGYLRSRGNFSFLLMPTHLPLNQLFL